MHQSLAHYENGRIVVADMDHWRVVGDVLRALKEWRATRQNGLTVGFESVRRAFPNTIVPLAAILSHCRSRGWEITLQGIDRYLCTTAFPLGFDVSAPASTTGVGRLWRFSSADEQFELVNRLLRDVRQSATFASGVLESFEICLNEITDNVLQHAQTDSAFLMVSVHPQKKRLAVCLADMGAGIYGTLKNSPHRPGSAADAITLAVKSQVTRDKQVGQGNGLWSLLELTRANEGSLLRLVSGPGQVAFHSGQIEKRDDFVFLDDTAYGTVVDFQWSIDKPIDFIAATQRQGYANTQLESFEKEAVGEHVVSVREHGRGTGTRVAGERLRNFIENLKTQGAKKLVIDFEGVGVISFSFADELVGKLAAKYGFVGFQREFVIRGATSFVQSVIDRVVTLRAYERLTNGSTSG